MHVAARSEHNRLWFDLSRVCVGCVLSKAVLGQDYLVKLRFPPFNTSIHHSSRFCHLSSVGGTQQAPKQPQCPENISSRLNLVMYISENIYTEHGF